MSTLLKLNESDDRGALAALRKGTNPDTAHYAWPYLARWCDLSNEKQRVITATVAACFAYHSEDGTGNLGTTLREIARGSGGDGADALKSFEGRFRRLLTCATYAEVCRRVLSVVRAAAQRQIPIDYRTLYEDLWFWGERAKLRWAASYWNTPTEQGGYR